TIIPFPMKTKLSLFYLWSLIFALALSPSPSALGQIPQGFNYQAIARDGTGAVLQNSTLQVRFFIRSESSGGTLFYQEVHPSVTTNSFGLFTLVVGNGTKEYSSIDLIDWSVSPKYLETEITFNSTVIPMGSSQLLAVPYAMTAKSLTGTTNLSIKGTTSSLEEALFEVKNKNGQTIFAVYNEGVRIYVDDGAKGPKGGFAVGGFDMTKTTKREYFIVSDDSVRIYLDDNPQLKTRKGGFAIGGYDVTKALGEEYLRVTRDSTRIYINEDATKGIKGGFAVGGFDGNKGAVTPFTSLTPKNYLIGHNSGVKTTGTYNSFMGFESGAANTTGSRNTFLGYRSGYANESGINNVFLGYETGIANTTGENNVFLGTDAGFSNTLGSYNVFIGTYSGYSNLGSGPMGYPGNYNVFLGYSSGKQNETGQDNVFLGKMAGFNNISGSQNTFIGRNTGANITYGQDNVFIGSEAGAFKTSGYGNTLIGAHTGESNGTGELNVLIGHSAGKNSSGSNLLYIENTDSDTPLIGGNFQTDKVAINGLPEASGATLQVNGNTRIGINGTNIESIIRVTVSKDLPVIQANETYIETFSVPNANITGAVSISPWMELPNHLVICYARVVSSGVVEVKFKNTAPIPIDTPGMSWFIGIIQ
ncbi:MAG TPA: hypothetical protein PKI12_03635, partial [Bacteroidales bacterium]|nr:hypothetical protein [Bacteroidales bacterium]